MKRPSVKLVCAAVSMLEQRGHKKQCIHIHTYVHIQCTIKSNISNQHKCSVNGAGTNGHPYGETKSVRLLLHT